MFNVTAHGASIPALGFGVFRMSDEEVERIVPEALSVGFRHFDTAQIYANEAALGRALEKAGAKRDDLSRLPGRRHRGQVCVPALGVQQPE